MFNLPYAVSVDRELVRFFAYLSAAQEYAAKLREESSGTVRVEQFDHETREYMDLRAYNRAMELRRIPRIYSHPRY